MGFAFECRLVPQDDGHYFPSQRPHKCRRRNVPLTSAAMNSTRALVTAFATTWRSRTATKTPAARAAQTPVLPEINDIKDPVAEKLAAKQQLRWDRFKMATLTSVLTAAILQCFVFLDKLPIAAFNHFALVSAGATLVFAWLLRTGRNLRMRDPSLTLPMMVVALGALLYVTARAADGHALLSILYFLPFVFGILRLSTRQLVMMALITLSIDLNILMLSSTRMTAASAPFEYIRLAVLGGVLIWFAVMGGFISNLNRAVQDAHTRLGAAFKEIEHIATHDELTGVLNRRSLTQMLAVEHARGVRYTSAWSVLILDIDHFKRVNDTLGHQAGDVVLRRFAQVVQHAKRPTDGYGRYGGEEFMLVLSHTDLAQAMATAERIKRITAAIKFPGLDPNFRVTVSIGVAQALAGEDTAATVARADAALYRAKQSGRNRACAAEFPSPSVMQAARESAV